MNKEQTQKLIEKSIKAHGGKKHFKSLKAISFTKTVRFFDDDAKLKSEVKQKHSFQLQPNYLAQIEWEAEGQDHKLFFDGNRTIKSINGEVILDSMKLVKATIQVKSAFNDFFQPFFLIDEIDGLTFENEHLLNDSIEVSIIKMLKSDKKAWYFFNKQNQMVASAIKVDTTFSLIENSEFQIISQLLFSKRQSIYVSDSLFRKKKLKSDTVYDNFYISH